MAVSLKTAGTWTEFTTGSPVVTIPGTPAAGDRAYVWVIWKNQSVTSSTATSNWTKLGEYKDGTVASGNGTGSMTVAVYYYSGTGAPTNPTITMSAAVGVGQYVGMLWQKGAGETWDTPTLASAAWPNQTSGTVTASSTVTVPDGSVVMNAIGIRDDSATFTRTTSSVAGWSVVATDDFTRADSTTSPGPNWTNRYGSPGVESNQFRSYSSLGNLQGTATHTSQSLSNNVRVSATVGQLPSGVNGHLNIIPGHSGSGATVQLAYRHDTTDLEIWLNNTILPWASNSGNAQGVIEATFNMTAVVGDRLTISRVGTIYTAYLNDTSVATWNDSGGLGGVGKISGLGTYLDGTAGTAGRWDDFEIEGEFSGWNGNYVESPATHVSSGTGNDMACDLGYRLVTTGASDVTLNTEATLSATETGAIVWVIQGAASGTPTGSASGAYTFAGTADGLRPIRKNTNINIAPRLRSSLY